MKHQCPLDVKGLSRGRKHFWCYFLQSFSTEEILKLHVKDFLEINGKQRIIMLKKGNILNSKIMKEKWSNRL